jgi:DNA-binding response OmpR family regulator
MEIAELKKNSSVLTPIKVLVADDDAPTRILLRAAVSQWGYEVVEASDGEEAWNTLQLPNQPQMMIVDWLMPKLDGIDLCRRIKNEFTQQPYIILLTQLSGTTNIVKGLEAGANEFLSKPFNIVELQSRLSVGARIIRYKDELAHNSLKMNDYGKKIEIISGLMNAISVKIFECTANPGAMDGDKIYQLQEEFNKMKEKFDELNYDVHRDGGA